jgi:hypothetical protein
MSKRGKLAGLRTAVLSGWEVKEKILRPVVVNLLTAGVIFLVAVVFKDRIHDYFVPRHELKQWPIYCILEPEPNNGGGVTADLFVMNPTQSPYSGNDLDVLASQLSQQEGKAISPLIEIAMKDYLSDKTILDVKEDSEFNKEKGSASISHPDNAPWRIRLEQIGKGKILKFVIRTNEEREISSRASFESLPIRLTYARSP